MKQPDELARLLESHRGAVLRFVEQRAGGALMRMETAEDLTQDICVRALRGTPSFEWRDDGRFRAWLFEIARNHMQDRRDHWSTLKRAGSAVLRLGYGEARDESLSAVRDLAASVTGPSTFAARREQIAVAARALAMLLPRDRALVEAMAAGTPASEHAVFMGMTVAAVESARKRALERLRKTFELALGRRG